MPNRVVWNLSYPTRTPDELSRFRHHFEALRNDSHVSSIEATERADIPYVMTMRVEFAEGYDRPDSLELRQADHLHPSTANIERHIVMSSPEPAQPTTPLFELPRITGLNPEDVVERMAQVAEALRVPDILGAFQALGAGIAGFPAPVMIPEWIIVGCAYRQKAGEKLVVTLQRVRVNPGSIVVEALAAGDIHLEYTLAEFVDIFKPYERPKLPLSAWERLLKDDD